MAKLNIHLKQDGQGQPIQWRKLVNVRDVGDLVAVVSSLTRILNQRGQAAVGQVGHGIRESHALEDVINIVDRVGKLVARKSREFEQKGIEAVHTVEQEVRDSPVVEQIETRIHRREKPEPAPRQAERKGEGETNVFVVGALLGTLLGALIALWFAPRSGEATRHEIDHAASEVRRRVEGESLHDAVEAGKAEARRLQQSINSR